MWIAGHGAGVRGMALTRAATSSPALRLTAPHASGTRRGAPASRRSGAACSVKLSSSRENRAGRAPP